MFHEFPGNTLLLNNQHLSPWMKSEDCWEFWYKVFLKLYSKSWTANYIPSLVATSGFPGHHKWVSQRSLELIRCDNVSHTLSVPKPNSNHILLPSRMHAFGGPEVWRWNIFLFQGVLFVYCMVYCVVSLAVALRCTVVNKHTLFVDTKNPLRNVSLYKSGVT